MTKDGTQSSQKAEMTPREFAERYGAEKIRLYLDEKENQIKGMPIIKDGFLSDLTSVIRGKLIEFIECHSDDDYYFRKEYARNLADDFLAENGLNTNQ